MARRAEAATVLIAALLVGCPSTRNTVVVPDVIGVTRVLAIVLAVRRLLNNRAIFPIFPRMLR